MGLIIVELIALWVIGLAFAMIIGQRRGTAGYLRLTRQAGLAILRAIYQLIVWLCRQIGYAVGRISTQAPGFVGFIVLLAVILVVIARC